MAWSCSFRRHKYAIVRHRKFLRALSLNDALDLLQNNNEDVQAIYIEPPDANVNSDEDSAEEDEGGLLDNLSGRQLRAGAEVVLSDRSRIGGTADDEISADKATGHSPATGGGRKSRRKAQRQTTWSNKDLPSSGTIFPAPDYSALRGKSALDVFETFFDDQIVSFLAQQTRQYALFKNEPDPQITEDEIKVFIAILILSGYNTVPGKRRYWESREDVRNEMVYGAIRRDRFLQIMKYIHCADNTDLDSRDKMAKLRPLMELLQKKFAEHLRPEQCMDYDECMIAYYGRHGCKQFIRGKPIRFGYKVWCLNTPDGYLVDFDVYQGKNPHAKPEYEEQFGKAASPLVQMLDRLPKDIQDLPLRLYFDNLFTGVNLMICLKSRGYGATGTVRENRVPKGCPLTSCGEMKKKTRGTYEFVQSEEDGVLITRWVDNSVVTGMSTCHGVQPVEKASRYSQSEKKRISVPRPALFAEYNKFMGGTDRMDENVSLYRIAVRGKKWWWPIFTWLVDVVVHNAWLVLRKSGTDIRQLEFRRQIVLTYLTRYKNAPKGPGRTRISKESSSGSRVSDNIRYDRLDHLVLSTPEKRRLRCAEENCTSQVRTKCAKCNVGLCIDCFVPFHTAPR
ncbi:piggyBac transposable element-derived protein 3-like [Ornithodoros turicata]|uniref:piggyBac transposable element-derived protein 3-like n=1 Tax=Ornithodoros turicata TaxID=34597 RepID=UPI00313A4109